MSIELEWDELKRAVTLAERGLDFADAARVLSDDVVEVVDDRYPYGEERTISFGLLGDVAVVIVWTRRGNCKRIISMRKANDRERLEHYRMG